MRDIGGYSFEEIASVVQLKEAHIRMILSRAHRKLRELYIKTMDHHEQKKYS